MEQTLTTIDLFLQELADGLNLASLFEYLPEVYLYVKDRQSRIIHVNQAWLNMRNFKTVEDIRGKTDLDLHPKYLAEQYIAEDQKVMLSRQPLPNQIWLVPGKEGALTWFNSTKIPLFNRQGDVIGLAGVMRDLAQVKAVYHPYGEFEQVLSHVLKHYEEPLKVPELAQLVHLSVSQFDRRFKKLYQMTPQQYILKVRLNAACHALTSSDHTVSQIAIACGFYDQSYFTRQFRKQFRMLPTEYRQKYATSKLKPS